MRLLRPLAWRPALLVLLCLAGGMAHGASVWWPVGAAVLALLCEGWRAKGSGIAAVILGIAFAPTEPARVIEPLAGTFVVRVATLPRAVGDGASFLAETTGGARLVTFVEGRGLSLGDVARVDGRLVPLQRGPDDYLISRQVAGRLRIKRLERVSRGSRWATWLTTVSDRVQARLESRLGKERGRLVGAVCFNFDGLLDDETNGVLRRSGAYHLVSASGMHVQVIAFLVLAAGAWVPVPRWAWVLFGAGLLILYSALTGWHAATLRSTLMWTVAALAYTVGRGEDGLSALGAFGTLWLVCNPADLYDAGFALTMIVTASLVAMPRSEGGFGSKEAKTGLVAWFASEPLLILMTGRWLPLAFPANIAVGLISSVVLVTGLLAGCLPGLPGDWAAYPAGWFADLMMAVVQAFARPEFGQVSLPSWSPIFVMILYAVLAGGWLAYESRRCPLPPP